MSNPLIISIVPGIILGVLNGIYWRRRGYRGWHLFYLGSIAFYTLSLMILKGLR